MKERIENVLLKYEIAREESKVKMIESIADDFAIGFAEWFVLNYTEEVFYKEDYTKELLEIYKKTL